jgi:hypothetical protein
MSRDGQEEEDQRLDRALHGIDEGRRPIAFAPDPGLPLLVGELREWLGDERQWVGAHGDQWVSLLDDLLDSRRRSPAALAAHLDLEAQAWQDLAAGKTALAGKRQAHGPDPATRRRLQQAAEAIWRRLTDPELLGAIFDDLLAADSFDAARVEGRRLWLAIEGQGLNVVDLMRTLEFTLRDNLHTIRLLRDERPEPGDSRRDAGVDLESRIALARSALFRPARRVDAVIWLKYTLAPLPGELLELGEAVSIFSAGWIREAIVRGEEALPPELGEDAADSHLASLARSRSASETTDEEEIPQALVRVTLGEVASAEALGLAQETAELLVSLASLQGGDPSLWLLTESYVRYYDGRVAGASFHAEPVVGLSLEQRQTLRSDPMFEMVNEWAEDLPPHLPLQRPDLRRAAQLALWLRHSRATWEPGRIVLCDRVFEQVAGWAGVIDRRRFAREYLRLPWALRRVRQELTGCWSELHAEGKMGWGPLLEGGWEKIAADPEIAYRPLTDGRYTVDLQGVLRRLDLLLEVADPSYPLHERLGKFRRRTITGGACAAWVNELMKDFDRFAERERRVRNALVHGGPVSDEMAASVLLFVDWLVADALHAAIKGMLGEGDVIDHFLTRRRDYEGAFSRLEAGVSAADALFWDSGT